MRITLSIPDPLARKFQSAVPARERSRLVATLLAQELERKKDALASACREANKDRALAIDIEEWQSIEDGVVE